MKKLILPALTLVSTTLFATEPVAPTPDTKKCVKKVEDPTECTACTNTRSMKNCAKKTECATRCPKDAECKKAEDAVDAKRAMCEKAECAPTKEAAVVVAITHKAMCEKTTKEECATRCPKDAECKKAEDAVDA